MSNAFAKWAKQYVEAGYSPVPIMPGTKRPGITAHGEQRGIGRWQRMCDTPATEHELEYWSQEYVGAGIGLALGFNNVVAIDIDVAPGEIFDALVELLPDSEWVKKGSKGFTAFFRTEERMAAQKFKLRLDEAGNLVTEESGIRPSAVLEILSYGNQTVIPPTVHPGTGKPYQWENDPLSMCPAAALPVLDADFPDQVKEALKPWGYIPRSQEHKAGEYNTEHGTVYSDLNRDALADLDTWVPHLDRVEFDDDHKGSGYRMRAVWRGGNSESSVRIDNEMIYDYGADEKISPIDLVVYMNDMTPAEAFVWLFDKVNWELIEAANQMSANWEAGQAERDAKAQREQEEWLAAQRQYAVTHQQEKVRLEQESLHDIQLRNLQMVEAEAQRKAEQEALDGVEAEMLSEEMRAYAEKYVVGGARENLEDIARDMRGLMGDMVRLSMGAQQRKTYVTAVGATVALMSVLYGRRWAYNRPNGMGHTHPNIYVMAAIGSGSGKTTSIEFAQNIFKDAIQEAMQDDLVRSGMEDLAASMAGDEGGDEAKTSKALMEVKMNLSRIAGMDDVFSRSGIRNSLRRNPVGMLLIDEAGPHLASLYNSAGSDTGPQLLRLLKELTTKSGGSLSGVMYANTAQNIGSVENPCFSLYMMGTTAQIFDKVPPEAYLDGLMGRILMLTEEIRRPKEQSSVNHVLRDQVVQQVKSAILCRMSRTSLNMGGMLMPDLEPEIVGIHATPEASEVLRHIDDWIESESERAADVNRPDMALWDRGLEMVLKIALLHALGREHNPGNAVITVEDAKLAFRLVLFSIQQQATRAAEADSVTVRAVEENKTLRRRAIQVLSRSKNLTMTGGNLNKVLKIGKDRTSALVEDLCQANIAVKIPNPVRADSYTVTLIAKP